MVTSVIALFLLSVLQMSCRSIAFRAMETVVIVIKEVLRIMRIAQLAKT
jgi:hypothetical protein